MTMILKTNMFCLYEFVQIVKLNRETCNNRVFKCGNIVVYRGPRLPWVSVDYESAAVGRQQSGTVVSEVLPLCATL